jgi:hemerythrin superfamily protein
MDIYQVLKEEHQKAKQLFAEIKRSSGKSDDSRENLFTQLRDALEAHSEAEEEVFYAPIKNDDGTKEKIEHAQKEHQKVTKTLQELDGMNKQDNQWLHKITQLKDDVQHHIQEEEGDIFKKAQGVYSKQQAEEMAKQFKQVKKQKV